MYASWFAPRRRIATVTSRRSPRSPEPSVVRASAVTGVEIPVGGGEFERTARKPAADAGEVGSVAVECAGRCSVVLLVTLSRQDVGHIQGLRGRETSWTPNGLRFCCGGLRRPPPSEQTYPARGRPAQAPARSKRGLGGFILSGLGERCSQPLPAQKDEAERRQELP